MPTITADPGPATGVFTRTEALEAGWTDHDLKSPQFRRVLHGVYRHTDTPATHAVACAAAAMRLPPDAMLTGRSAATLYGVPLARAHDPVEVVTSGNKRTKGLRCWNVRISPGEHVAWRGIRMAKPLRVAFDLLARNPLAQGVATGDALLHAGVVTRDALGSALLYRHDDGIVRARKAFALLDGRAESIPESILRVRLVQVGLSPQPQFEVPGPTGANLRLDLGFEEAKVAVEYDGTPAEPGPFHRDQHWLAWLHAHGWHVIVVTAKQLNEDPRGVVDRVHAAVGARTHRERGAA